MCQSKSDTVLYHTTMLQEDRYALQESAFPETYTRDPPRTEI